MLSLRPPPASAPPCEPLGAVVLAETGATAAVGGEASTRKSPPEPEPQPHSVSVLWSVDKSHLAPLPENSPITTATSSISSRRHHLFACGLFLCWFVSGEPSC